MEFNIEKYAMLINRSKKRQIMERIELLIQKKIKAFGEKKNYKYERILTKDTMKQVEMKKKKKDEDNWEIFSKLSSAAWISSKE